ncbi:MAG TPA: tetratricopeptide repeat protein [Vicinamibacterales bacterium]|jgi:tetratricopeptide (TPR) repeat protein
MKRTAILALLVSAALLGTLSWQAVVRERDYRRLIADGDQAVAADQTFPAVEAYSGAIALRRDSMLAYLKRGETYRRRGEMGAALRDLREASRLDRSATRPLELLGDVNAELERFARAEESYDAYLRLDDRSPRVLYKLALTRYRLGQPQRALEPLRQALALDNRMAPAHYLLGLSLRSLNNLNEATDALERAVRLEPGLMAAREELARIYASTHREREAITQLEALAALEPSRPERQVALGLAYARSGRSDMAVVTLRRVVEEHPENSDVYVAIGRVWLETAEAHKDRVALNKALEALDGVARRSPPGSEALLLLGRAQALAGETTRAEQTLKQAAAQFPIDPVALLQLSMMAENAGHFAIARDALARYTALSGDGLPPADRAIHLGDLSMRLNEPATATSWYAKAAQGTAAPVGVFVRLANAQLRAGDRAGAIISAERGLQREPRNPTLLAFQRQLRSQASTRRHP